MEAKDLKRKKSLEEEPMAKMAKEIKDDVKQKETEKLPERDLKVKDESAKTCHSEAQEGEQNSHGEAAEEQEVKEYLELLPRYKQMLIDEGRSHG
jgi:hypothetical protein